MWNVDFAIKFGSNEIIIYRKSLGIIAKEPAFMAVTPYTKYMKVRAVGSEAQKLYMAKTNNILVYQPIKNGEILDKKLAAKLIREILKKCIKDSFFLTRFNALVAVPCAMNQKQLHDLKSTLHASGIDTVTFVQNGVCARANIDKFDHDQMALFVDIGKYITDVCVLNDQVFFAGKNFLIGGNDMDNALSTYIKDNFDLDVTLMDAEKLKNNVGSLYSRDYFSENIVGISADKKYKKQEISASEVRVAITNIYDNIFCLVKNFIEELPNEIIAQIYKNGIIFSGGAANISGLFEYAKKHFEMPVYINENPSDSVILGAGKLLHFKNHLKINF